MSDLHGERTLADASGVRVAGTGAPTATASRRSKRPVRRPRRPLGSAVMHAPQVLRAMVRADEIWLVVLAAFLGCGTGIAVWMMTAATQLVHEVLFDIGPDQRLSAMSYVDPIRTVAVPTLTAPRRSPPSNPLQEKSKVEPRKTSGGWSSCSVMPCRSQMFCSRKSQR